MTAADCNWLERLPCLHEDMPAEVYHGIAAMSAGGLKRMRQSPAHFYGLQLDPQRPPHGDPTPAMKAGTLLHCALFEPAALFQRYITTPDDAPRRPTDAQRNAAKPSQATLDAIAYWADFEAARAAGKEVITEEQLQTALRQARAVQALPDVAALMRDGYAEASAFWTDGDTGALCKCRPDWVARVDDGVILVDGKTAVDASPDGFARAVVNFGYHLQAAWYSDGFEAATGRRVLGFVFATVESAWPHCAAAYMLPDDVLDRARAENRRLLTRYAECMSTGAWPGYADGVSLLTLPKWANI